jgi:hypothetical protein
MKRLAMRRSLALALMAGLIGVNPAPADEGSPPPSGTRIRVTAPGALGKRVVVGRLLSLDGETLSLQPSGGATTLEIPRAAITRLELSRRHGQKAKGAARGLMVGVGAATVIGVMAGHSCRPEEWLCFNKADTGLMAAVLTVPLGVLVGIAAAPSEKWDVYSGERLRVGVAPVRKGGVGGSVSVRF